MGIQITIERDVLEEAGWKISSYIDPEVWDDDNQFVLYPQQECMVIEKGDYQFVSYVSDCFFADSNAWGQNHALFKKAGLLDLPHILA